jgi:hypothetical protein
MDQKKKKEDVAKFIEAVNAGVGAVGLLSTFEFEAEETKRKVGQAVVDKRLEDLPPEDGRPKRCPICGKEARVRKKAVPRTFKTLSGTHTVCRDQHYCAKCRECFYPRDEELGLPKRGEASVELERRIADWVLLCPPDEAEEHWNLHNPLCKLSATQFRQTATRLGKMAEDANPHLLQSALSAPEQTPSETVYFMSDGSMVLLREEMEKLEKLLGAGWREMKLGMVFRHEDHVMGEEVTRGVITNARYVGDFSQEKLKEQIKAAVEIECTGGASRVVYLADGAPENWAVAEAARPGAIQILDWYHAIQNVMKFGKTFLGEGNELLLEFWKKGAEHLLAQGQINLLLRTLMETMEMCDDKELGALDGIVRYLRNNEQRMDYPTYRSLGLLIGSGPIESAQRHVLQMRMKRSGQRWSQAGARRMARLRTALKTSGTDRFYRAIQWAYRETQRNRVGLKKLAAARKAPKRYPSNR